MCDLLEICGFCKLLVDSSEMYRLRKCRTQYELNVSPSMKTHNKMSSSFSRPGLKPGGSCPLKFGKKFNFGLSFLKFLEYLLFAPSLRFLIIQKVSSLCYIEKSLFSNKTSS
jgi:hypothetical protein